MALKSKSAKESNQIYRHELAYAGRYFHRSINDSGKGASARIAKAIITVILFSVLVYEIMGPILAKIAIQRAGEENGALRATKNSRIIRR